MFAAQHRADGICDAIAFRPDRKPARDRRSSSLLLFCPIPRDAGYIRLDSGRLESTFAR
ncbi:MULTISPECIES: hypothetical protein [Stenotrophomonas]|uniref:hypothetical protein n=1 Tax=Stenotrophomonas TaxID=40323 RepID=UPI0012FDF764|nr:MULTISPECIES: hypothetical protein [Stenotrophomonas]